MFYKYNVLSETGNELKGSLEGHYRKVAQILKEKNYHILSIEPDVLRSAGSFIFKRKVGAQTLATFFEDMANMLKTGIAIDEVITALRESSTEKFLIKALDSVEDDLASGFSLAASFERAKVFPDLVLNMLKVGEKTGNLEKVLGELSGYYSREAFFLRSLKSACFYPLVILCMLIGIMFYVSFKVIPHLEALLPITATSYFATRMLLSTSHFLNDYWYLCVIFPLLGVFIYSVFNARQVRRIADYYYKIPLLGELAKEIAFSAFFSSLALLQRNGISLIDSLTLIEETASYKVMAKKVSKIKDFIISGLSLWQTLEKDPFFPSVVYYSVRKGEETGSLDKYLESLSKYYSDKVTRRIRNVLGLIQPALLVFCAIIMLFLVSAFIMPVYSNLSNIAGGNVRF